MKMFTKMRGTYGDIKVIMYDYVPVISADKNDEWVTMWYKQIWQDIKGKCIKILRYKQRQITN